MSMVARMINTSVKDLIFSAGRSVEEVLKVKATYVPTNEVLISAADDRMIIFSGRYHYICIMACSTIES